MLELSRDAYYKWRSRPRKLIDFSPVLKAVSKVRRDEPRIGTRKLHQRLNEHGIRCGRDSLFRSLREQNMLVRPKRRFTRTTYSNHNYAVAPNLLKKVVITAPNQVFVSDITYVSMRGGFAYLFLVTDYYSRKIVGHHLSRDLSHHSALLALQSAISNIDTTGAIHHSDRGCQYCCHEFLRYLQRHKIFASMTDENHCYQNAVAERVNGILKNEFDCDQVFRNFEHAQSHISRSIHVYNYKRTHWSLNLQTPEQVYKLSA